MHQRFRTCFEIFSSWLEQRWWRLTLQHFTWDSFFCYWTPTDDFQEYQYSLVPSSARIWFNSIYGANNLKSAFLWSCFIKRNPCDEDPTELLFHALLFLTYFYLPFSHFCRNALAFDRISVPSIDFLDRYIKITQLTIFNFSLSSI